MARPSAKTTAARAVKGAVKKRARRARILVPIDGSPGAKRALDHAIALAGALAGEIELLNVQAPVSGDAALFVSGDAVKDYHRAEAKKVLRPASRRLEKAGIAFQPHVCVGPVGATIARFATESKCDRIVMGRGSGSPLGFLLGSTASKVMELVKVPVTLVK